VYNAQLALIKQHSIPHRFENDGRMLLLGPFSLHRKLLSKSDKEETLDETTNASINPDNTPEYSGGVIPDDLFCALSFIGMETVEEGPILSVDELEMLRDVLTKKLDGFGGMPASSSHLPTDGEVVYENDEDSSLGGVAAATVKSAPEHLCAESVEAYKDGQRELLQFALAELDALMPCDSGEEELSS